MGQEVVLEAGSDSGWTGGQFYRPLEDDHAKLQVLLDGNDQVWEVVCLPWQNIFKDYLLFSNCGVFLRDYKIPIFTFYSYFVYKNFYPFLE